MTREAGRASLGSVLVMGRRTSGIQGRLPCSTTERNDSICGYAVKELGSDTWKAFARLAERHAGTGSYRPRANWTGPRGECA